MNKVSNTKILKFEDLFAWQEGHKFVLDIYALTKTFPKEELFTLTSQMRRCAISVTSNIAEGFGKRGYLDKARFYDISNGSLLELKNQLIISRDLKYLTISEFDKLINQVVVIQKLIQGLIKSSKALAK